MRRLVRDTTAAAAAIAITAASALMGAARNTWEDSARSRKLDYIYMEAQRQSALDNNGGSFELLQRVYEMDTTDTHIGGELGCFYIALSDLSDPYGKKGLDLIRRRFETDPADLPNSFLYARLNQQADNLKEALRVWHTLDSLNLRPDVIKFNYVDALLESSDSADIAKAIDELGKLEVSMGANTQLTSRNVYALMNRGDTVGAINSIGHLLQAAPRVADNYVFAGNFYMSIGEPDTAIRYFNRACEVDTTNGYAYYTRADYYRQINDSVAFNRETTHALLYTDLDIEVKNEILLNFIREFYRDSTQEARIDNLLNQVVARNPHEYSFRDIYASYLGTHYRYKEAAEQSDRALDIDPSESRQWKAAIAYHSLADDNDGAIAIGLRAIKYHPAEADLYRMLGSAFISADRYDEALDMMNRGIEATDSLDYENLSIMLSAIADIYSAKDDNAMAFDYYDKALEKNPGNILAMNNMAYHLSVIGQDLDKAERLSATTIREEPDNATYLDTYAWIMFKKHDYAKAREYIDRALEHEPEPSAELYEHAGDIYFLSGNPETGIDYWQKAHDLDPDNQLLAKKLKQKGYFYE